MKMTTKQIAEKLGFNPNVNFVTYSAGRVGFSAGKPEEVRALLAAVKAAGMRPTRGLRAAAEKY